MTPTVHEATHEHASAVQLTDAQANTIYRQAYNLSQRGHHEEACSYLAVLRVLCPHNAKYAQAMGVCLRKLGRHKDAALLFARTLQLAPAGLGAAFQLVECLVALGRHGPAREVLSSLARLARAEDDAATADRAEGLIALLDVTQAEPVAQP